jgi:hypothetical protein
MFIALVSKGYNKVTWVYNIDNLSFEDFERRVYKMYPVPEYSVEIYKAEHC